LDVLGIFVLVLVPRTGQTDRKSDMDAMRNAVSQRDGRIIALEVSRSRSRFKIKKMEMLIAGTATYQIGSQESVGCYVQSFE